MSPQGSASHQRFSQKHSLNFPLLVDSGYEMARAYGVAEEGEEGRRPRIKRSTFVIDEDGTVIEAQYGVRAKGHVDSLLADIGG